MIEFAKLWRALEAANKIQINFARKYITRSLLISLTRAKNNKIIGWIMTYYWEDSKFLKLKSAPILLKLGSPAVPKWLGDVSGMLLRVSIPKCFGHAKNFKAFCKQEELRLVMMQPL